MQSMLLTPDQTQNPELSDQVAMQQGAFLELTQSLSDACLNVVQMTHEIPYALTTSDLRLMHENLSALQQSYSRYERRMMALPFQNPAGWQAWKLIQELAVLIHGYEQALNFKTGQMSPQAGVV